jgi:short-subunit dehydrogenase
MIESTETLPKVVLLTGASTGLGLEIAKQLMKENFHLVLTARPSSMDRFKENGIENGDNIWLRPLDVTDKEQRVELMLEINQRLAGVDILINNAGFTYRSVVEHVSDEERIQQMSTNFLAPMELTRLVLPFMRSKHEGKIINISSVGGMMAMPTMSIYSASKFALEGLTEILKSLLYSLVLLTPTPLLWFVIQKKVKHLPKKKKTLTITTITIWDHLLKS